MPAEFQEPMTNARHLGSGFVAGVVTDVEDSVVVPMKTKTKTKMMTLAAFFEPLV